MDEILNERLLEGAPINGIPAYRANHYGKYSEESLRRMARKRIGNIADDMTQMELINFFEGG